MWPVASRRPHSEAYRVGIFRSTGPMSPSTITGRFPSSGDDEPRQSLLFSSTNLLRNLKPLHPNQNNCPSPLPLSEASTRLFLPAKPFFQPFIIMSVPQSEAFTKAAEDSKKLLAKPDNDELLSLYGASQSHPRPGCTESIPSPSNTDTTLQLSTRSAPARTSPRPPPLACSTSRQVSPSSAENEST